MSQFMIPEPRALAIDALSQDWHGRLMYMYRMYNGRWLRFAHRATGQGINPLGPSAAQIAALFYYLFDTHGLSPQTIKPYRSSVISCTCKAAAVQAKTNSGMITSVISLTTMGPRNCARFLEQASL